MNVCERIKITFCKRILTSMEMIALCRVMAILHFKVCMPLRWLAGNTHKLGQQGYDWSPRSMGKAVDAPEEAMMAIEEDGSKFLNEEFLDAIFSEIYVDEDRNIAPLDALQQYMNFMFEEKQTNTVDGSKVVPLNQILAELLYPQRKENIATTQFVKQLVVEVAQVVLRELRDVNKATSDYLSSIGGKFSWGQTTDEEHEANIGWMTTNDPAESPFASLTQ